MVDEIYGSCLQLPPFEFVSYVPKGREIEAEVGVGVVSGFGIRDAMRKNQD